MECGIQQGHGMRSLTEELVSVWGNPQVMLSPRNFKATKRGSAEAALVAFAEKLNDKGAQCFVDPQLFSCEKPHKNVAEFGHSAACAGNLARNFVAVLEKLESLNEAASTTALVLPSSTADHVSDEWLSLSRRMVEFAANITDRDLLLTVALSSDALRDGSSVGKIVELIGGLPVRGAYLVVEHPKGEYLTDDALWLLNMMLLTSGIKRSGKQVLIGYANQQQLMLSLGHCDVVFTGNFQNVRCFERGNFSFSLDESPSQRSCWYYAPLLYAEFRTVSLDLAQQIQEVDVSVFGSPFSRANSFEVLFGDGKTMPSQTAYNERDSFDNYLTAIHEQCVYLTRSSYRETLDTYRRSLATARALLEDLKKRGVYDSRRSFLPVIDACESAVNAFDSEMGFQMSHSWSKL